MQSRILVTVHIFQLPRFLFRLITGSNERCVVCFRQIFPFILIWFLVFGPEGISKHKRDEHTLFIQGFGRGS